MQGMFVRYLLMNLFILTFSCNQQEGAINTQKQWLEISAARIQLDRHSSNYPQSHGWINDIGKEEKIERTHSKDKSEMRSSEERYDGWVLPNRDDFKTDILSQESLDANRHDNDLQLPVIDKGKLLYENRLSSEQDVAGWVMEGPGEVKFQNEWMEMFSPAEKFHHVFWCPEDFPSNFIAEWEVQNKHTEAGLCIIFFSAKGKNGENIFDPSFPFRDGTFNQYTKSDHFNSYHISYYANGKDNPGRETSHLRKNSGFHLVQEKEPGIAISSKEVHKLKLVKNGAQICMYVDHRKIIDWTDDGELGPVLHEGKIGFRQMQWTQFRYRNFSVWEVLK